MKVSVKAHPKSKQSKVVRIDESHFEIWVNAAPDKGKANVAIIESLSEHLQIPKSRLSVISGATSKNKIIEIL